jgi:hypothetical protein
MFSTRLPFRGSLVLVFAVHLSGCMAQYKPPTTSEPHAILKVRRTYGATYGNRLAERVVVDGSWALKQVKDSQLASTPQTDAVLVHPKESNLTVDVAFSHQENRTVSESYSCGTTQYPRTCYRTVSRPVTVIDSACDPEIGVRFEAKSTYLIELNMIERGECIVRCYEQVPTANGQFDNKPCALLPMDNKSKRARE